MPVVYAIVAAVIISPLVSLFVITPAVVIKCFFDDRISVNIKRIFVCIGILFFNIIVFIAGAIITDNSRISIYTCMTLLMISVLIVLPIVLFYKRAMPKRYYLESLLLFFAVANATFMCTTMLSVLTLSLLNIIGFDVNVSSSGIAAAIMMLLIFILLCLWLSLCFIRKGIYLKMRKKDTVQLLFYYIAAMYFYAVLCSPHVKLLPKLIRGSLTVFSVLLILIIPIVIIKTRQTAYFSELSTRSEQFLEAELAASNAYRQSQEDTRAFRHDMNNNLAVVSSLMKKGDYREAEQYINELHGRLASFSPRIVTGDDMLDALICSKLTDIESKGISFTVNGVIEGGLGWKPIDICAVFANMIDNAAEACERMTYGARYIDLSFRKTEHQRIITLRNSTAEKVDCSRLGDGTHYTSKADSGSHGFGVKNIKDTLNKNGAMMQLCCSENEFMTTIILTGAGVML